MNIMLEEGRVIVSGSDGAYIGTETTTHLSRKGGALYVNCSVMNRIRTMWGAEQRPVAVRPTSAARAQWPATLAACAVVCALDHGNVGAAIIIAVWWFGWAVGR